MQPTIYTIGHSTRPIDELVGMLRENGVDLLVDVRTVPRSRFNPQFNGEALAAPLKAEGIGYVQLRALGGLRHHPKGAPPSPNTLWHNASFRAYADYAMTAAFREGLAELRGLAEQHRPAIMCAEAVWWRCHRRIITDYLLAGGALVRHIKAPGKCEDASLTPGAEPQPDGSILYPEKTAQLSLPV
jgi:uncharacterized protein (DUF488 family)